MKNTDNIADTATDFRDGLDAPAAESARLENPRKALRLSTLSKARLCLEILTTNKTQSVLAREHGCSPQAISYYAVKLLPHRRRCQPIILFKQGKLELLFD